MTYSEDMQAASESLAYHIREAAAGRIEVAAYAEAHAAALCIARKHRLPFRTVWEELKSDAAELLSAY